MQMKQSDIGNNVAFLCLMTIFTSSRRDKMRHERMARLHTLKKQLISLISVIFSVLLLLFILNRVLPTDNIFWFIGLFATAFGLGFRQVVVDVVTGIQFMIDDPFEVGDKVELMGFHPVDGVIEHVDLRKTVVRARTGEQYTVPNSEIRNVRNFSRGKLSDATVFVHIDAADLAKTLTVLDAWAADASDALPNLVNIPKIICDDAILRKTVALKVVAHAQFGTAATLRPHILAMIYGQLYDAGITVAA